MVPNEGDAWEFMLKELHSVFINLDRKDVQIDRLPNPELFARLDISDIPDQIIEWVDTDLFLKIQKLALRTAEMHIALGSEFEETAFARLCSRTVFHAVLISRPGHRPEGL